MQARQQLPRLLGLIALAPAELVGNRQEHDNQRLLVLGVDRQYVLADAFGLSWLVEQPIPFGFLQGRGDALLGKGFEFKHTPLPNYNLNKSVYAATSVPITALP